MAANNRGTDYADLWRMFKEQDQYNDDWAEKHRKQILHWMNLEKTLPILSWRTQLEVLDNAPMSVIKAHVKLLHPLALKKLGLEAEKPRMKESSLKDFYGVFG